ncbi:MAG TPA: hypothetical protein VNI83_08100 [Vicinamibacterales bacterium]|nr:hypothetical protein [Vicinamibacterales bacterium]
MEVSILPGGACDVAMALAVEGTRDIEHRLAVRPGTRLVHYDVSGADVMEPVRSVGSTLALRLRLGAGGRYILSYRVQRDRAEEDRCPLWLPAVAADGRSRPVTLAVRIPPDRTAAGGEMPALAWHGRVGRSTLGHLPTFVRVALVPPGAARGWGVTRVMDATAILAMAVATLWWVAARRRA